eukprot:4149982-Prymnesium_polylepis.1
MCGPLAVVNDGNEEVAHQCVLLEAMRSGYRSLQLRDKKGTPIDLCCLLMFVYVNEQERPVEYEHSGSGEDLEGADSNLAKWRQARTTAVARVPQSVGR